MNLHPQPFPTWAFPDSIRAAIAEARQLVKAPDPIIAASVLASLSIAGQGLANVRRPNGIETPVSLFIMVIAESGERKSTTDALFTRSIRDFELAQEEKAKELDQAPSLGSLLSKVSLNKSAEAAGAADEEQAK